MSYELGVDLGTTYTAAAVRRAERTVMVELGNRSQTVPSVVLFAEDGSVLLGEAAQRRSTVEPERIAREYKRRLGDPTPILIGGTPHSADALTGRMLRWVVDLVTEREGGPPRRIGVAYPANWGPYKLDLLQQAIRQADITNAEVITEPEAAVIHYASQERISSGSVIAVYDLGGGTFDSAIVRKTADGVEVLGEPEGIERLGGIDFDQAVVSHVLGALGEEVMALDQEDPLVVSAIARLRNDCVEAKEALSSDTQVSIPVLLPGIQTEVRLTRGEFETMIRPTLEGTISALNRALRSADLSSDDLTAVLLVGGSSRIPLVAEMVGAELGRPVAVDAHPKHAVALGAALLAAGPSVAPVAAEQPDVESTISHIPPPPPPEPSAAPAPTEPHVPTPAVGEAPSLPPSPVQPPPADSTPPAPARPEPSPSATIAGAPPVQPPVTPRAPAAAAPPGAPARRASDSAPSQPGQPRKQPTQAILGSGGSSAPTPAPTASGGDGGGGFPWVFVVIGLVVAAVIVGAIAVLGGGGDDPDDGATATATEQPTTPVDEPDDGDPAGGEADEPTPADTSEPTAAATEAPTEAPEPTATPEPTPVPPACEGVSGLCAQIESVAIVGGELSVEWTAVNFPGTPDTDGSHVHFYWSTFEASQVGTAGGDSDNSGAWDITATSPFVPDRDVLLANRPPGADVCVTPANEFHQVIDATIFDCMSIPEG